MKSLTIALAFAGLAGTLSAKAFASKLDIVLGPPSVGQGGSNPVSIPPLAPIDWQISYINDQNRESVLSIIPGFLYGQRWTHENLFAALGGGLLITTSGLGAGVYHAFGFESREFAGSLRMLAEYRQVIGIAEAGPQFPYSLRIGVSYAL